MATVGSAEAGTGMCVAHVYGLVWQGEFRQRFPDCHMHILHTVMNGGEIWDSEWVDII